MQQSDKLTDVNDFSAVAMSGLSEEQKREFRELGEKLYGRGGQSTDAPEEVRAFVTRQVDDGIHPSFLSEGEKAVMETNYGTEWYKKWGYVEADLTEVVTVDRYANLN